MLHPKTPIGNCAQRVGSSRLTKISQNSSTRASNRRTFPFAVSHSPLSNRLLVARRLVLLAVATVLLLACGPSVRVIRAEPPTHAAKLDPAEGYRLLTEKPYLPPDFDQEAFDEVWKVWPEPLRSQAEKATLRERRQMTLERYGLCLRPGATLDETPLRPLQYVVTPDGQWSMNCFACHGGKIDDVVYPGSPNRDFALETLTSEIRQTKLRMGKRLAHMDVGSLFMPLGRARGTTNAVMFGVALLASRAPDLSVLPKRVPPSMVHHDMDAPPWWHVHRKKNLYIDGFAPQAHRPLMQFMLVEQNGPEDFASWEEDFRHVQAYIQSLRPPKFPQPIDTKLAEQGRGVFETHCAECHGTYGEASNYPERLVDWEIVRTDRVRLDALTPKHRQRYAQSWFAVGHSERVVIKPAGYVAPPLDGIWATAPYLHNGSIPTLWHLLRPDSRPKAWQRRSSLMDYEKVGLKITSGETKDAPANLPQNRFDTERFGKSAEGHDFAAALDESERTELLEYLKTL